MIIKNLLTLLFCTLLGSAMSQKLVYKLKMEAPQNHYYQVEMELSDFNETELKLKMPVWAPGSYLVREFAKNVDLVVATDEKDKKLPVEKSSKNTWLIKKGNTKKVKVRYEVYAFELSVRTSFLDLTHGYVSGSGVFMYIDGHKEAKGCLDIYPHASFKTITTALSACEESQAADNGERFKFDNYDQLADCPIEIGNQEVFDFTAAGTKHTVAIYSQGNHNIEKLKVDMAKIVETATAVFGQNPNKNYTFIIHNVERAQGGLEHTNSTTLSVNRWSYEGAAYLDFLNLVAHEYFHLWNVKRIRPIELGPFNYDEENYTTLLWVMEGFTSYYDELIMRRAGFYDVNQYLTKLNSSLNYVEGSVGARVQPLAHASFDAWIKSYRPNENSANTTMTYYSRGQLMAALFDAMIVDVSQGKQCLDHFMQSLYSKYYEKLGRGFTDEEFRKELELFTQSDLKEFWDRYINGTEIPDYDKYFSKVGVKAKREDLKELKFGASMNGNIVRGITRGSGAELAGISVNDEIIALDNYRVDGTSFATLLAKFDADDTFEILLSRDNILMTVKAKMKEQTTPSFKLVVDGDNNKALREYWLR
jgi:predicted metalloprotease with PDZ domain